MIHVLVVCTYAMLRLPSCEWFRFNWLTQKVVFEYLKFDVDDAHNSLSAQRKTIFFYHPHGVYAAGFFGFFAFNKNIQHITLGVSSILFRLPWIKDIMYLIGAVPVNKKDLISALQVTNAICICPGGLRELLVHKNSANKYFERKRAVMLAQEVRVNIVLVEAPDEAGLYNAWIPSFLYPLQNFLLKRFLYPFPIFSCGNPWIPWWPKRPLRFRLVFHAPVYADPNVSAETLMEIIYTKSDIQSA